MSGGGKGGDSYWPGFVDALTNVVIAMVFVIVVLAIALSFSAQLLAQRMAARMAEMQQTGLAKVAVPDPPPAATREPTADGPPVVPRPAPVAVEARVPQKLRIPVTGNEAGLGSTAVAIRELDRYVVLEFAANALTLDDPAQRRLIDSLEPFRQRLAAAGPAARVALVAQGPAMTLSENQRAAFIRVMAVRNLLIDHGITADRIATRIETAVSAPGATVSLSFEPPP